MIRKSFLAYFVVASIIMLYITVRPVNGFDSPAPKVSASFTYLDACDPEFFVNFEVSNLGTPSGADSIFAVSVSGGLNIISWDTTSDVPDLTARVYESGDTILNDSGVPISATNTVIELYNHSFRSGESVKITMVFEFTVYQSINEWIKYRLTLLPEDADSPTLATSVSDPTTSNITDQQGYPVYEISFPIDTANAEPNLEDVELIPEFPSWMILPLILTATLFTIIGRRRLQKTAKQHSY